MDDKKKCDGHCERCNVNQRTYCAAQMAYYNQKEIASIKAMILDNNQEIHTIMESEDDKDEDKE